MPFPNCKLLTVSIVITIFTFVASRDLAANEKGGVKKVVLPIAVDISEESDQVIPEAELKKMSYNELDASRESRKLLLEYLIEEGKIRESHKGTIDFLDQLNQIGRVAVKNENLTRRQMFALLSKLEKRSIASIGREFNNDILAIREKTKAEAKGPVIEVPTSLLVNAPPSLAKSLLPNLVSGYLQSLGYGDIKVERKGELSRIVGKRSFGSGYLAVDYETRLPGASAKPTKKCVLLDVGGSSGASGTFGLQGVAIVVHPDNPIKSLTVGRVADIFAGKVDEWSDMKVDVDGDIKILLPSSRPVLTEQFGELVMKPEREKMVRVDPSENYLKELEENPNAIAFCLPGEFTDKVKAIQIQAASDCVALAPSSNNVKSMDYPLLRFVSAKANQSTDGFIRAFIDYCQSEGGQRAVNKADGYIGLSSSPFEDTPDEHDLRRNRLVSPFVPDEYKELIEKADRKNSPANFRFVPGSGNFELTDLSKRNFEQLANYLLSSPDKYKKVILFGFADSNGDAKANKTYSLKRADSIADRLREKGIEAIETVGIGEDLPIADNDKEDGRASNRRVEVWLER